MYPYHLYPCTYFIGTYLLVLYYLLVQPYCTTSYGSMVPAFSAVQTRVTKGHPPGQRAAQRRAVCSFYLPPCFCTATSGFVASSCALCWPCCLGARRTCGLLRLRTRKLLCVPPCSCAACCLLMCFSRRGACHCRSVLVGIDVRVRSVLLCVVLALLPWC